MSSLRDVDISSKSDSDLSDVPRNCEIERLEEILKGAGPLGSGSIDPCRCPECNPNVEGYAATATWTQDELLEADFRESVAAFTKDMQEIAPDLLGDLQIGFDPAELMKKQALQVPKHILPGDQVPRSSIGGFPHAIFRCFEVLPAKQCEVLLPALRLATTWITHPSMTLYWQNQIAAPRCLIPRHYNRPPDDDPDRVQRAALQHIIGWSQTNHEAWLKMLPNIARFNYFCFQDNEFGRPARAQMVTLESFRTRVSLSMASQIAMINLSQVANPDPGQLLRFNFQLANMLCHELAHVVEFAILFKGSCRCGWVSRSLTSETWMKSWPESQFGRSAQTSIGTKGKQVQRGMCTSSAV